MSSRRRTASSCRPLWSIRVRSIWKQLENNLKRTNKTFADEGKTEDEARDEYRRIAERRVRLGLVIGEIGEKNEPPDLPGRVASRP